MNDRNEAFLDELAALVDGEPEALERWADHLADVEAARDLRHEAATARDAIPAAANDYESPDDLAERVLALIDAREGAPAQAERSDPGPSDASVSSTSADVADAAGANVVPAAGASPGAGSSGAASPGAGSSDPTSSRLASYGAAITAEQSSESRAARVAEGPGGLAERGHAASNAALKTSSTGQEAASELGGANPRETSAHAGEAHPPETDADPGRAEAPASADASPEGTEAPASADASPEGAEAPESTEADRHVVPIRRIVVSLGLGAALAAAAGVALFMGLRPAEVAQREAAASGFLGAQIARIARAADGESQQGVTLEAASGARHPSEGEELAPGSRLRTDPRTRARLELSDGSSLVLNQDTEIVVGEDVRSVRLVRGEVLAEVAHREEGPRARYETPVGVVEVVGTKFVLSAIDDRASVRVTQGTVRIHSEGRELEVKTGQEGLMRRGAPPEVVPALHLASAVSWSELDPEGRDDLPVPGLGELRAHRPGEREEQERPLHLAHHKVKVRIVGNVARTEIEETFRNESAEVLEGVYRFPLPPDARIASLSLEVDGQWEQGAFVDKQRGQQIWRGVIRNATPEQQRRPQEEYIWVPGPWRDPALLEWQRGGRFELRIFPIPARGERRIRLAYEQTIAPHADGRRYVYPLAHASDDSTRVGHFEVDVRVAGRDTKVKAHGYEIPAHEEEGAQRLRYARDDFRPAGDLAIDYRTAQGEAEARWWTFEGDATAAPPAQSREGENVREAHVRLHEDGRGYVLLALRPELPAWSQAESRDYVLVVDSSQSMVGDRYRRATRLATGIVDEMDRRDRVMAVACDLECRVMESGPQAPSSATAAAVQDFLEKAEPAGSSNLTRSLRQALEAARRVGAGEGRALHLVYVGDGMSTAGPRRAGTIAAEVAALTEAEVRVTAVGIGQDADAQVLAALARVGGGHYVPFVPGQRTAAAALAVLETTYGASLEGASVTLPGGIADVAPTVLPTLRHGQEVLVVGRLEQSSVEGEVVLRGKIAGRPFEQRYPLSLAASRAAGNAFVPRLWASKTIESLELGGRSEDRARIVALSKAYNVMSRETSLLVLESEAMFRAFGVDRAQAAVQWTGEEDMEYGEAEGTAAVARQAGILGLLDSGRGASGRGASGRGASMRRALGRGASMRRALGNASGGSVAGLSESRGSGGVVRSAPRAPAPSVRAEAPLDGRPSLEDEIGVEEIPEAMEQALDEGEARRRSRRRNRARRVAPPRMRGGRWMRKVWFREGRVRRADAVRERDIAVVRSAEEALRANENSRDRHRDLVRALSRAGQLERAEEVARAWLARDRMDAEALTYLSDVVGRQGKRSEALRLLSGIVDLQADDARLQRRLAGAFERAGKAELSCAHRFALAELDADDAVVVATAIRCARSLGRVEAAGRLLEATPEGIRENVSERAARAPSPTRRRGELIVEGTWEGGDIDLTIVTPQGTRLSWMGGRVHVVGDDASAVGREMLGLRRAAPGTYYLEVNRVDESDTRPVRGTLRVRAFGERESLPFELSGRRAQVGQISVVRRWRIER